MSLFVGVTVVSDEVVLAFSLHQTGVGVGNYLLILNLRTTVSHTEKRRLEHENMPFLDQFRIELQEERDDKQTNVHAIDVGICSYNNLVIAQVVKSVFNIECRLQQVKLLIFVYNLLA